MSTITPEIVKEHGLSEDEYQMVLDIMGREPNINELGIFSVMWSEHCSYKSSKKWLKTLPTKAPWVIRSEEHTSELQSHPDLLCRLLLVKKQ